MQWSFGICASLFVAAVLSPLAAQENGDKKNKREMPAEARLVCEQFANAWLVKQDLDGAMKLSAVPAFWWSHVKSAESVLLKPTVVRTLEDLKKEYVAELAKFKPVKGDLEFRTPGTYENFRRRTNDAERSAFDEVLKSDDWIVGFQATSDDRLAAVVFLVAKRDEKWKVVGHLRTDVIMRPKKALPGR